MAASANDKARKSYSFLQKTLQAAISDVATVLTPNNVANIPDDTGVSFVVDRVDSSGNKTPTKRELMTGVISGGTVTGLKRGEQGTTAQSHAAGAVIEFVNSGEMWNDLIDFMLQDHDNPNGGHKNLTDLNGNEWLERGSVASAVNHTKVSNAATGNSPRLDASGDDSNIDHYFGGKGTGVAHAENPEILPKAFVASGGLIAISSGLIGTFSNIVYYIGGKRYKKSSVANRTYTASKDTYVDIDAAGTLTYTEVANNAASPALAANNIRLAKVVTGAASISRILQNALSTGATGQQELSGLDSLGNSIYPTDPQGELSLVADGSTINPVPTALTDVPNSSVVFKCDTAVILDATISAYIQTNSGGGLWIYLNVDGADQGRFIHQYNPSATNDSKYAGSKRYRILLAAGTHTIKMRTNANLAATVVLFDPSWVGVVKKL